MAKQTTGRFCIGLILLASATACDAMEPLQMTEGAEDDLESLPAGPKTDPAIVEDVQAGRSRQVLVMLSEQSLRLRRASFQAKIPAGELDSYLQAARFDLDAVKQRTLAAAGHGASSLQSFDNLPLMLVHIESPEALAALEANPEVAAVVEDRPNYAFDTPSPNLTLLGQPTAAAAGFMGANTAVAVLDTGTDYTRAPFNCTTPGQPAGCAVAYAKDFAKEDNVNDAGNFHGTNVSGVVLSIAPSAKIIALDVFDGTAAYTSVIVSAIDWCIANKSKYNIVAINLSLGGGLFSTACTRDAFASAISAAKAAGILTVVASGNDASSTSIASPACVPGAVAVGAVYDRNVGALVTSVCKDTTTAADKVACFSNSNDLISLLAPGVGITAAGISMSGTSQASPHVAGAVALLAAASPSASTTDLLARLTTSRTKVTDARNKVVKPRLDLPAALSLVSAGTGGSGGSTGSSASGGTTGTGGTSKPGGTGGTGGAGGTTASTGSKPPAPSGQVIINKGDVYTKSRSVTVDVTTTSGVASHMCVSATSTCSSWKTYVHSVTFTLSAGDGSKTVNVWWKNSAGVASSTPGSSSIVLDSTAPKNGIMGIAVASGMATLAWSGFSDATSSVASYKLVSATKTLSNCSRGTVLSSGTERWFRTAKLPTGTSYFRVCAVDGAGNVSTGVAASIKVTTK